MQLLMIRFEDRNVAQQALEEVELTVDQAGVHLTDLALAYSSEVGTPRVRQTSLAGSGPGLLQGGLLGLLAAIVVPVGAVAGTLAGGALGGVIAGVGDNSVDNSMMRALGSALEKGGAVLLALGEPEDLAELHGVVDRCAHGIQCVDVPPATQYLMGELTKLSMEELASGLGVSGRGGPRRSPQAAGGLTATTGQFQDDAPLSLRGRRFRP